MDGDWTFSWDDMVSNSRKPPGADPDVLTAKPSLRKAYHRRSNSTPLEHTSSVLLNLAGDDRANGTQAEEEQQEWNQSGFQDSKPAEKARSRKEPKGMRRSAIAQAGVRSGGISGSRMSARNSKGKSKLAVLHEGFGVSSDEDQELSGDDGFGPTTGKGDKVKRVLANRQSAQRSRIRKLAHIEELMQTAQILQNDINKLGPQLNSLHAKEAGLNREKEALQQQLAVLMQESQRKESVNQSLTHELANYAQAQNTGQQQQAQQSGQTQSYTHQQQQHYAMPDHYCNDQYAAGQTNIQDGHSVQSQSVPEEPDIVDRLMLRYQYDQAQAWQRHQQQQQQLQWQQQQQQQGQVVSSPQSSARAGPTNSFQHHMHQQQSQQHQQLHQQQERQHQPAQIDPLSLRQQAAQGHQLQRQQASQNSSEVTDSQTAVGLMSRHHSLDSCEARSASHSPLLQSARLNAEAKQQQHYLYPQQHIAQEQLHRLQRHSFDAAQLQHNSPQQAGLMRPRTADNAVQQSRSQDQQPDEQSLFRTQSLTPYQSQMQRHNLHSTGQQQQQQQQQLQPNQHSLSEQALRNLQRPSAGQNMPDLRFIPLRGHNPQVGTWQTGAGSDQSFQRGLPSDQAAQLQQQQQAVARKNSGTASLHSISHLSRHSSTGSDAQLSELLPSDGLLRTWDLASNASSEPSEAAALYSSHGSSSLNMMMPSATSSVQAAASSQTAGTSDAVRQVVWSKGMPPSGKKKKDSAAAQRAVFTRLI